jgi:hypothetical protein
MAVELCFKGTELSETDDYVLQVFTSSNNELVISLDDLDSDFIRYISICLDKTTAIKFSKELRKQIALLV